VLARRSAGNRRDEALYAELLESAAGRLALEAAVVRQACAAGMPLSEAPEKFASTELRVESDPQTGI
jgi:hypothetical protein